jgi:hypothetical protein
MITNRLSHKCKIIFNYWLDNEKIIHRCMVPGNIINWTNNIIHQDEILTKLKQVEL